jgi:hypothetical protein
MHSVGRIQSFSVLKQVVYIVTTGFDKINELLILFGLSPRFAISVRSTRIMK